MFSKGDTHLRINAAYFYNPHKCVDSQVNLQKQNLKPKRVIYRSQFYPKFHLALVYSSIASMNGN